MGLTNLALKFTGYFSVDRCKALTDGVFAIVVTLLVLGINVPLDHNFSEKGFLEFLKRIGFDVFLYAISFWLVGTYWILHTAMLQYARHGSRVLIWLNLLFLFFVTLIPFLTELKVAYRYEPFVTLLFGVDQIFIGFSLIVIWLYVADNPHLLNREVEKRLRRKVTLRLLMSPVLISAVAIPVSFFSVHLSGILFLSIPLFYLSHRDIDQNWSVQE